MGPPQVPVASDDLASAREADAAMGAAMAAPALPATAAVAATTDVTASTPVRWHRLRKCIRLLLSSGSLHLPWRSEGHVLAPRRSPGPKRLVQCHTTPRT